MLYAEDYSGPDETPEGICARDWTRYDLGALNALSKVESRLERVQGRLVCRARAEGSISPGEQVQIREGYGATKGHVFVTTASGPAQLVEEHAAAIEAWRPPLCSGRRLAAETDARCAARPRAV